MTFQNYLFYAILAEKLVILFRANKKRQVLCNRVIDRRKEYRGRKERRPESVMQVKDQRRRRRIVVFTILTRMSSSSVVDLIIIREPCVNEKNGSEIQREPEKLESALV